MEDTLIFLTHEVFISVSFSIVSFLASQFCREIPNENKHKYGLSFDQTNLSRPPLDRELLEFKLTVPLIKKNKPLGRSVLFYH